MKEYTLPKVVHIAFEKGLFLGPFVEKAAAERLLVAREKTGKTGMEIATYVRVEETDAEQS
jgi:hypothetical protein